MQVVKKVDVNTNNAWGFGGWVGTLTYYDNGVIIKEGRNHHRHTDTSSANEVRVFATEDFDIGVKVNSSSLSYVPSLKGVGIIYIYTNGEDHYQALTKEWKDPVLYGKTYTLIKTVEIPTIK